MTHLNCKDYLGEVKQRRGLFAGFFEGLSFFDTFSQVKRQDVSTEHITIDYDEATGFMEDHKQLINDYKAVRKDVLKSFKILKAEINE